MPAPILWGAHIAGSPANPSSTSSLLNTVTPPASQMNIMDTAVSRGTPASSTQNWPSSSPHVGTTV